MTKNETLVIDSSPSVSSPYKRPGRRNTERVVVLVFALVLLVVAARTRSTSIPLKYILNLDEGDILASGRRGALSLIPFKDFTATTYGPMWPFILGWLHRLGMPLTLPMSRVLDALIIVGCCTVLVNTIRRQWNVGVAILAVTPLALHWIAGFNHTDFLTLSTEMLGLVFLIAGCMVAFSPTHLSIARAIIAASLFGCALWSKYSFVFVVAVALLALVVRAVSCGHRGTHAVGIAILFPLAPFVVLGAWAGLFGVPAGKIFETIHITVDYLAAGGTARVNPPVGQRIDGAWTAISPLKSVIPLVAVIVVSIIVGLAHGGLRARRVTVAFWALSIAALAAGFMSLMVVLPLFAHYVNVFLGGLILAVFLVSVMPVTPAMPVTPVMSDTPDTPDTPDTDARPSHARALVYLSLTGWTLVATAWAMPTATSGFRAPLVGGQPTIAWSTWSPVFTTDGGLLNRLTSSIDLTMSQLCPEKSRVLVWGWAPELYAQYDWTPASRYVITTPLMTNGNGIISNPSRYRPRFFEDFFDNPPACIVDAAVPSFISFFDSKYSLAEQMPSFAVWLDHDYSRVTFAADPWYPITVWVRNT